MYQEKYSRVMEKLHSTPGMNCQGANNRKLKMLDERRSDFYVVFP